MLIDMTGAEAVTTVVYKDDTRCGYWIMVLSILRNDCNEMIVCGAAPWCYAACVMVMKLYNENIETLILLINQAEKSCFLRICNPLKEKIHISL